MKPIIYMVILTAMTVGMIVSPSGAHAQHVGFGEHCANLAADNPPAAQWQRAVNGLYDAHNRIRSFQNIRVPVYKMVISFEGDRSDPRCTGLFSRMQIHAERLVSGRRELVFVGYAPRTINRETFTSNAHARLFLDYVARKLGIEVVVAP